MAYIYKVEIDNTAYLVQPYLYVAGSGSANTYTATLEDFTLIQNTVLFIKIPVTNTSSSTLSINNGTAVDIYYQGSTVDAGMLLADQTYILTYNNSRWNILNDLTKLSAASNGGLVISNNEISIDTGGIVSSMIAQGTIANDRLQNDTITIGDNSVALGGSITLSALGLSTALHFKGIAANDTLQDGSKKDPFSVASTVPDYDGEPGDVAIDSNNAYEYVWVNSTVGWELLGGDQSYKLIQTAVSSPTASGHSDEFIDTISQNANGEITATKKYVSSWHNNRKVYADLTTDSTTTEINGSDNSNASAIGIGVHGVLGVDNGGIGTDENDWSAGGILYGALSSSVKQYTSIAGNQYQILTSGGSGAPVWTAAAYITSNVGTEASGEYQTILELGNQYTENDSQPRSEGIINLFSAGSESHIIKGESTSVEYTHILPNQNGYLLSAPLNSTNGAVGNNTQPIYLTTGGVATALTYTANRLYYSASTTSFAATGHYATSTSLFVNKIPGVSETITQTFYVDGTSLFTGTITAENDILMTAEKAIKWGTDASIFYHVPSGGTGNLTLKTGTGLLIALNSNNADKMFFDNGTPSFYPAVTSTGSIGLSTNKWAHVYTDALHVGMDAYGEYGKPVYWSNGIPVATCPLQYIEWTIASGAYSCSLQRTNKYYTDTHVIAIVVTSGQSNLPAPLTWDTDTVGTLTIHTSGNATVSGAVSGYVYTARVDDLTSG